MPSDPDDYFAARDFDLVCHEDGGVWWADLHRRGGSVVSRYGRGPNCAEAKARALQRWLVEQEPPATT
jgi:hypothetical protein